MKLIICDDENVQIALLQEMIAKYAMAEHVDIETVSYTSAKTLLWDIEDGLMADGFLLDIQMNQMNGMELAHQIRDRHLDTPICFITGVKEYVFEGYDVNAIGYILKPFEQDQIHRILQKMLALSKTEEKSICIPVDGDVLRLKVKDLIALEACGHDTALYVYGKSVVMIHTGIQSALKLFPEHFFFQIHRSYAVNLHRIVKITKDCCVDENQKEYPISRGNRTKVMQEFMRVNKENLV